MTEIITPIAIEDKMRNAYLNYSLSVIVARALPDVRDGLKPVHRRILYASQEINLNHNKPYKKSARIVGEVLGKYHPHGDQAVYNAMVRMAQDFNQRYCLIDGHGNFGSIDGDSPAAMRYTEVRMTELAEEMLTDIKQETVNFIDNFDASLQEPVVLPTRFPNLLINGVSGIAVGMSTDIPPHNLTEVIDGLIYLLKHPEAKLKTIMKYIPGPDFPTGAKIIGQKGIIEAYKTGKGKITLRAIARIEKKGKKEKIIITEIPYQINKSKLIEEIAEMINKGRIEGISDLRDESDQDGLRIIIELKAGIDSELILNRLYKYSSLQTTYRINMLALVNNRPEVMNLITILQYFIDFRRQVITHRTQFNLNKSKNRYHILQGLIKAINKLDLVISIIRHSNSTQKANINLQKELNITEEQAKAILQMQLQRLVGMETEKLLTEAKNLTSDINNYENILNNKSKLDQLLEKELLEIKKKFGDKRKTQLIFDEEDAKITKTDLIKEKNAIITFSYRQNIKHTNSQEYARTGKNDFITQITSGTTLDTLLFFTQLGNVYTLLVYKIPEHHGLSTGENIKKFLKIPLGEKILNIICLNKENKENYITIVTKQGLIKRTSCKEYITKYANLKAIKLNKGDLVINAVITDGKQEILLGTKKGQTIRFKEDSISNTGRNTMGSIGIKLKDNDEVISMNIIHPDDYVISISDSGKAKRTPIEEYTLQKRNGRGLKTTSSSIYQMTAILCAQEEDYLLAVTNEEKFYPILISNITKTQRQGNMYRLINLNDDNQITRIYKLPIIPERNEKKE